MIHVHEEVLGWGIHTFDPQMAARGNEVCEFWSSRQIERCIDERDDSGYVVVFEGRWTVGAENIANEEARNRLRNGGVSSGGGIFTGRLVDCMVAVRLR